MYFLFRTCVCLRRNPFLYRSLPNLTIKEPTLLCVCLRKSIRSGNTCWLFSTIDVVCLFAPSGADYYTTLAAAVPNSDSGYEYGVLEVQRAPSTNTLCVDLEGGMMTSSSILSARQHRNWYSPSRKDAAIGTRGRSPWLLEHIHGGPNRSDFH